MPPLKASARAEKLPRKPVLAFYALGRNGCRCDGLVHPCAVGDKRWRTAISSGLTILGSLFALFVSLMFFSSFFLVAVSGDVDAPPLAAQSLIVSGDVAAPPLAAQSLILPMPVAKVFSGWKEARKGRSPRFSRKRACKASWDNWPP